METKRLFVGGLYRGVKEEDLRYVHVSVIGTCSFIAWVTCDTDL